MLENLAANLDVLEPPKVDNLIGDILPIAETIQPPPTNQTPAAAPLTMSAAVDAASTYIAVFNGALGMIGEAVGGDTAHTYQLNQNDNRTLGDVTARMLFHNGVTAVNPNIMFGLTTIVILFPKIKKMVIDRKKRNAAAAPIAANVPRGTLTKNAAAAAPIAANVPRGTTTPEDTAANVPRGTTTPEEAADSFAFPANKEEALKIDEIKFGRANFEIAAAENTPDNKKYYAKDVRNARIKNNEHGKKAGDRPTPYFMNFFIHCEKLGLSSNDLAKAAKILKSRISKRYKISSSDINAALAEVF